MLTHRSYKCSQLNPPVPGNPISTPQAGRVLLDRWVWTVLGDMDDAANCLSSPSLFSWVSNRQGHNHLIHSGGDRGQPHSNSSVKVLCHSRTKTGAAEVDGCGLGGPEGAPWRK